MALTHRFGTPFGAFTRDDGDDFYRITAFDAMPPFLINVASDSDLWMFVSSAGGLTAGRVDAEGSLFPYETVDKLHDAHHHTGPVTLFRVQSMGGNETLWQPFDPRSSRNPRIERNLYKNALGNRLIFEEIHHDLALSFRYRWSSSDEWGWVRTATLENHGGQSTSVSFLDGLRNILPYGAPLTLYQTSSTLVDAYKKTDLDVETGLGIFALTSRITDRPEAAEELRANTVWCSGLAQLDVHLGIEAVEAFRFADAFEHQDVLTGRRGNYLVRSVAELTPRSRLTWHLVANVAQSHGQIAALRARLEQSANLDRDLEDALDSASENLRQNVGSADGIQLTGHEESAARHLTNVLFNNMRGGVFVDNYDIPKVDFVDFVRTRNRGVAARHAPELTRLRSEVSATELQAMARRTGDSNFERLTYEYLPLHFGRRHGDPSRPWNRFSIHVRAQDGARALRYEGNWRDIFQNWEATCQSFPGFLPSVIAKFVNASTVDGFNPYRLTRDGFEWEVNDPNDPWSHIGYWGDHQIVYLLRLLESLSRFAPETLHDLLLRNTFCYADVPYRLRPYREILRDPYNTIAYDEARASQIESRVGALGMDGQLVSDTNGQVYHVNLIEKLLVPALSKLSNFVPGVGIWMNTQRPEWNDANNALAGKAASVVTLCYLRRYLAFLIQTLDVVEATAVSTSKEVADWLQRLDSAFRDERRHPEVGGVDTAHRKQLLDAVGEAFSTYRKCVYRDGFSGKVELSIAEIVGFMEAALEQVDHTIRANRRADGLYHTYNLLAFSSDEISSSALDEMLEGQVAALSSGLLEPLEAVALLTRLFDSRLYRSDQKSFLLYPERERPAFIDKNRVPDSSIDGVPLLSELLDAGERSIVERDALGVHRFHPDFTNAEDLGAALDRLAGEERWATSVRRHRDAVVAVFDAVFDHRRFTGRSSAMYGFEGIGCVYWHMVSKLLLAVQQVTRQAERMEQPAAVRRALATFYQRTRDGLGFAKTPLEFGAFPTDPYSHTPAHAGAQQPGMTGQVKEEILTRFGELGVLVEGGCVRFQPQLLRRAEFRSREGLYVFYDVSGHQRSIDVPAGSLAFSFCQIPVLYQLTHDTAWIRVTRRDGSVLVHEGDELDARDSSVLFARSGDIERLDVGVQESLLEW